jgi:hypothetical protein
MMAACLRAFGMVVLAAIALAEPSGIAREAGNCDLLTKSEAAAALGQKEEALLDGNEIPVMGCTYFATAAGTGLTVVAQKFDTPAAARSHYNDEAAHNLSHAPRQTIAGLGDAAFVELGRDMGSITVLKSARVVRIVLTDSTKLADPKGALTKAATAVVRRL